MGWDIREYFGTIQTEDPGYAVRVSTQLARGGITKMDDLCELLKNQPDKISSIRNIGPKSMTFIRNVCKIYSEQEI